MLWSGLDSEIVGIYKISFKNFEVLNLVSSKSPTKCCKVQLANGYATIEILYYHYYLLNRYQFEKFIPGVDFSDTNREEA